MRHSVVLFLRSNVSRLPLLFLLFITPIVFLSPNSTSADTQGLQLILQETGYLDFVAFGTGTRGDPATNADVGVGTFVLDLPSDMAQVRSARLIWTGRTEKQGQPNIYDDDGVMLSINGATAVNIMADSQVEQDPWFPSQQGNQVVQLHESADVTALIQALIPLGGTYSEEINITVTDHEHGTQAAGQNPDYDLNYGVGMWVIYEYPGAPNEPLSEVLMYEGQDSFFRNWTPPRGPHSDVQCVSFPPSVDDRIVEMTHLVSGVDLMADPDGKRSNAFWFMTGTGTAPTFNSPEPGIIAQPGAMGFVPDPAIDNYPLRSSEMLEWDNFVTGDFVQIPAGNEWACFQIESGDSQNLSGQNNAHLAASGMWNFFGIRMPSDEPPPPPPPPTAVSLVSFTGEHLGQQDGLIKWVTDQEIDNFAYNLYRSSAADFATSTLIHQKPTKVAGGTGPGATYDHVDTVPQFGRWWYWLEDVDTEGNKTQHGPIYIDYSQFIRRYLPIIRN
ncbi:MAG: hypothetical protein AAF490_04565 [Chloroflexota bacterium]